MGELLFSSKQIKEKPLKASFCVVKNGLERFRMKADQLDINCKCVGKR